MNATDPAERVEAIDVLRGIALFGVMTVNLITDFRVSIFEQFLPRGPEASVADRAAGAFVELVLQSKSFALFSFLFGVSLAILYERLTASARPLYWLSRRMAALLVFGLVHLVFIWNGDILASYALAGFLVLPLLGASTGVLAGIAAACLAFFVALPTLPMAPAWPSADVFLDHISRASHVYATGSYGEIRHFSAREMAFVFPLHVYVFPRTLALFLLGVIAWRSEILGGSGRSRRYLRWIAIIGCGAGGLLTIGEYLGAAFPFRNVVAHLTPVVLALGYAAAVIACAASLRIFAPIGRMAFTNYVLQSIVFGFIFFGYGLGYFGRLGAAPVLLLDIAFFALQCRASALWLRRYRFGPLEWLWRSVMYGRFQPMRLHGR